MKTLSTLIIFLFALTATAQQSDLQRMYADYIEYCNETVTDTIAESGVINGEKIVPVFILCGQITSYKQVNGTDTIWSGYDCPEYKLINRRPYISSPCLTYDSVYVLNWGKLSTRSCNKNVTRMHVCTMKRERPSPDGFLIWVYNQLEITSNTIDK